MKKQTKLIGIYLIIMANLLILTGCGSTTSLTPAPAQTAQIPQPQNPSIILATTTSTQDSGLLEVLVPEFEKQTGYKIQTIAVGTGAALAMGEKGEADVLLVHAPASEKKLVDNKIGINYNLVMHNDFIIIGPTADPAKIKGLKSPVQALKAIADSKSIFISRGDKSGTDTMEKSLWKTASITPSGTWYQESGTGMGQTLKIASEKSGYILTDRATYLATKKSLQLDILVEGDASLLNIYHVMQINPEKFPKVNSEGAKAFDDFMLSPVTQQLIGNFGKVKFGQALFFPDAGKKQEDLGK
ncbi:MAG: substrate-binding domain-containing protein [Desulfitobacteriaceae bacterium]